jgi:hypothetical protein
MKRQNCCKHYLIFIVIRSMRCFFIVHRSFCWLSIIQIIVHCIFSSFIVHIRRSSSLVLIVFSFVFIVHRLYSSFIVRIHRSSFVFIVHRSYSSFVVRHRRSSLIVIIVIVLYFSFQTNKSKLVSSFLQKSNIQC